MNWGSLTEWTRSTCLNMNKTRILVKKKREAVKLEFGTFFVILKQFYQSCIVTCLQQKYKNINRKDIYQLQNRNYWEDRSRNKTKKSTKEASNRYINFLLKYDLKEMWQNVKPPLYWSLHIPAHLKYLIKTPQTLSIPKNQIRA